MSATTLTAGERRSLGHRGWKTYWTLTLADEKGPLRDLLGGALRTRCYEAVAAALRLWDEMSPRTREKIERRSRAMHSPESLAKRIETENLRRLIEQLSAEQPHRERKRNEQRAALVAAYREELALRASFPERTIPAYDWGAVLLTPREEALLMEVRRRLLPESRVGEE